MLISVTFQRLKVATIFYPKAVVQLAAIETAIEAATAAGKFNYSGDNY